MKKIEIIQPTTQMVAKPFECRLRDDWPEVICVIEANVRVSLGESPLTFREIRAGTKICQPCITPQNRDFARCVLQDCLPLQRDPNWLLDPQTPADASDQWYQKQKSGDAEDPSRDLPVYKRK